MTTDEVSTLYQQLILDHASARDGYGDPAAFLRRSHQINPTCGDEVTVGIRIEGDRVGELRWDGQGCAISQASASMLAGIVDGRTAQEARDLVEAFRTVMRSRGERELDEERFGDAVALNGVPRYLARVKCAMLPWLALEQALAMPDPGRDAGADDASSRLDTMTRRGA